MCRYSGIAKKQQTNKPNFTSKSHSNKMTQLYGFLLPRHYAMSRKSNAHLLVQTCTRAHFNVCFFLFSTCDAVFFISGDTVNLLQCNNLVARHWIGSIRHITIFNANNHIQLLAIVMKRFALIISMCACASHTHTWYESNNI